MNLSTCERVVFSLATFSVLAAGLFLLLTGTAPKAVADGDNVFVMPGGSGDCAQANPCDLQTALSTATDGDTLYLGEGAYTGAGGAVVTITKSIALYGGWDGTTATPPVRDPDAYPTVIDGEDAQRGVYIGGPVTVTLEGLTIARGRTLSTTARGWDGAGLYARDADLTLRFTNVYSNVVDVHDTDDSRAYGGGAAVDGGKLLVEDATFRWNSAWARAVSRGGGLSISETLTATVIGSLFQDNDAWHGSGLCFLGDKSDRAPLTVKDCTFADNGWGRSSGSASGGYAGAIEVKNAHAHIVQNVFRGNRASNDYGAVAVWSSSLSFTRNVITGNTCGQTSGLYLASLWPFTATNNIIAANQSSRGWLELPAVRVGSGRGQFLHNTIAQNDSTYGLQVDSGATVALTNTLLVSHTVGITVTGGSTARLEGTLWGSGAWANLTDWGGDGAIVTGTVNVWGDPRFVNPDGGDYHIGVGSAARDKGVDAGVDEDIDGESRPEGNGYDIGADESGPQWDVYLPLVARDHP